MDQGPPSTVNVRTGHKRPGWTLFGNRFLLLALVLSICVHAVAALSLIYLPRLRSRPAASQEQGTVELLMVEQQGTHAIAAPASKSTPTRPPDVAAKPPVAQPAPASKAPAATPPARHAELPRPQPPEKPAAVQPPAPPKQAQAQSAPPQPQKAPVFDLEGTGSESNAIVLGGHVLPAMPDDKFRNRPPIYPSEAATLGQHGAVVVMIHVSANGAATGADVVESSGVAKLDEAAVAAVLRWHFHPAMKDGQTVPSNMPFRFVFEAS